MHKNPPEGWYSIRVQYKPIPPAEKAARGEWYLQAVLFREYRDATGGMNMETTSSVVSTSTTLIQHNGGRHFMRSPTKRSTVSNWGRKCAHKLPQNWHSSSVRQVKTVRVGHEFG